jgi:undecaprenol kinase
MKNQPFRSRLRFALAGIAHALTRENSFRFQVLCAVVVLIGAAFLKPTPTWWAILLLTVMVVLAAELFNTALEELADHLHPDQHPRIKVVKDCAAGAVLLTSIGAVCVAIVFVWQLLS